MITLKANAKVNLTLDIVGKYPDGYHKVEMVMQSINLHDILEIRECTGGIFFSCNDNTLPVGPENLVLRAAKKIMDFSGIEGNRPVHIHLHKRIPVAAGLGGGSADAAATLIGLNHFYQLGLSKQQLMNLGAEIGSDVPFCILGETALATGRGEVVSPLPSPPKMWIVLVKPDFGVSTARVYSLYDHLMFPSTSYTNKMINALNKGEVTNIATCLGNALEPATFSIHSDIRCIKDELLDAGALGAEMSGSGPTVFAIASDYEHACYIANIINKENRYVVVTSTV